MRLHDVIDEKGRYCGFIATSEPPCGEVLHQPTISYAHDRRFRSLAKDIHDPYFWRLYESYTQTQSNALELGDFLDKYYSNRFSEVGHDLLEPVYK